MYTIIGIEYTILWLWFVILIDLDKIVILNPFDRDIFLIKIYPFHVFIKKSMQSVKKKFISYVAIWPINWELLLLLLLIYEIMNIPNFVSPWPMTKEYCIERNNYTENDAFIGLLIIFN